MLVIQEIFGVHDYIQDVCRRFAKLGYLAIAPELYARQGDPSKAKDWQEIRDNIVAKVPDEQVISDLDAAAAWAEASAPGDLSKLFVTGFCWGGRMVWFYAAHNPRLKAAVAWYGRLAGEKNALHPREPVELVGELKCPLLGLYGGLDKSIPRTRWRRCERSAQTSWSIPSRPRVSRRLPAHLQSSRRSGRLAAYAGVVPAGLKQLRQGAKLYHQMREDRRRRGCW